MRTSVTIAAVAFIIFMPMGAFADGPAEEMTDQMHEWVQYERPSFKPVEVQVDGAKLTVLDATLESHPLEEETTIVRVVMRARRGESPAAVSRAVLKARDGSSYPVKYVKATPVKAINERGFKSYTFRLPETDQEGLESLVVTVASANGAEPASTQVKLAVGEQIAFSNLDNATFSLMAAFLFYTSFLIAGASGI
ncbi:MAG: hypothetical protein RX316_01840 [bacterium]|nr:hypothetical protein [bacterium]